MEEIILTEERLKEELEYFLKQDAFVFDVETMDGSAPNTRGFPTQNRVVWIGLATYGRAIVIPVGHPNGDILLRSAYRRKDPDTKKFVNYPPTYDQPPTQIKPSRVFELLRPLFFNPNITKVAHNEPFDAVSTASGFGQVVPGPFFDTIVAQWLLDENIGDLTEGPSRPHGKGLKVLTDWYYGVDYDKEEVGKCIEAHPFTKVARYLLFDVRYDWLLYLRLREQLREQDLLAISALENEVTEVVSWMDAIGAHVDVQALEELRVDLTARLELIEAKIYRAAGRVFNIGSVPQKQAILYDPKAKGGQGLKPVSFSQRTGKPSTDKKALENYKDNPVVAALLEYQEISKLLGTYVIGYLGDPDDPKKPCRIFNDRIHTDLVQYGTLTGRFSSREPNLQNIPAPRSDLGKKVRGLFTAPEGYKLLVADYGQMELRILASYIGYGGLFDGFMEGIDAHTQTASLVFDVSPELLKLDEYKWMRNQAKTLNFAIVYGAGVFQVAQTLGVSMEEAQQLLDDHRTAFPEIYKFKDAVIKRATEREVPHIRTILGRERRVWEMVEPYTTRAAKKNPKYNPGKHYQFVQKAKERAERQIINSLIQGSLGDIIKLAMVRMHKLTMEDAKRNPGREIRMILSVHDELVIECPEDRVEDGTAMLLEAMTGQEVQDLLKVPLDVGKVAVVDKWSQAKE